MPGNQPSQLFRDYSNIGHDLSFCIPLSAIGSDRAGLLSVLRKWLRYGACCLPASGHEFYAPSHVRLHRLFLLKVNLLPSIEMLERYRLENLPGQLSTVERSGNLDLWIQS